MLHKTNIVIPLKNPFKAKQRLKPILNQDARVELVITLFRQLLETIQQYFPHQCVLVITDSNIVENIAKACGTSVLMEVHAKGLTAAVEKATLWSIENGFESQLVIPPDLAQLDPIELGLLLDEPRPTPSVLLCPAKDYGTNAVLTTPPNAIDFWFGHRSFFKYKKRAQRSNIFCKTMKFNSMKLDIDTPNDIKQWMSTSAKNVTDNAMNKILLRSGVA